ncbi:MULTISPECIES: hypothetical protein [Streptomyces]|uniref:Uncharacterized protein n=1 Tax=Streptomyces zinciresistens K42 TaxID=700597 RepID=G2G794_9ACTN|nr:MULTISPECIES: hypothetical protein [Streptomyces]EGX60635.1 hypothetical protein SZN_06781 [Streptomyces zinciresistens K42]MDT9695887.1 hypothetical protein [Streptomyces sp. P17]
MTAGAAVPTAPAEPGRAGLELPARRRLFGWSQEMAAQRRELERGWTAALQAGGAISPPPSAAPAQYLADGGGFRVPAALEDQLSAAARAFFDDRVVREGWVYLRGFGYYAADAQMYLPGRAPAPGRRFAAVQQRWPRYAAFARPLAEPAAREPAGWYAWLAWLAFLESAVQDVCSARWSAAVLGHGGAAGVLDEVLEGLGSLLAEAAWNRWQPDSCSAGPCDPATWAERAAALTADARIPEVLCELARALQGPEVAADAVRAVREGDVLWQIAAVAQTRWPALAAAHPGAPVLLVSEAFGAMAAGPVFAGMLPAGQRGRVRLALARGSVHEEEMARVSGTAWRTGRLEADGQVVVHLDDSVFTGLTHAGLRRALTGVPAAVYLVPLTLDVGTPFNHPEEITALGRSIGEHLAGLESAVRAAGGALPPAPSLWARRKTPAPAHGAGGGPADQPRKEAFARVAGGSDRLMALLWDRYAPEVRDA